jgi:hypothetical protein
LAPKDERLFGPDAVARLRPAVDDLCWLLSRGYATPSAVELVGNRYTLTRRQRLAVSRSACSDEAAARRHKHELAPPAIQGCQLWIDGFNLLTVLETALAGGVVLLGRDGCCRDVAGVHRRYRRVEETVPVLELLGQSMSTLGVAGCRWLFDKPVSNSGRLRALMLDVAAQAGWNWDVHLVFNPDAELARTDQIVVTADSVILDRCQRWFNLARRLIEARLPQTRLIVL